MHFDFATRFPQVKKVRNQLDLLDERKYLTKNVSPF